MKIINYFLMGALLLTGASSCSRKGCTDPQAENFDKKAKTDDGSCVFKSRDITENITQPLTIAEGEVVKVCGAIEVSAALTLSAGASLVMCSDAALYIAANGSLTSNGTADKPVIIKGQQSSKGFWHGIFFNSNNPNNKLTHTNISDAGGYWYYENAGVYLDINAQARINNCKISNHKEIGLFVGEGSNLAEFENNSITDCGVVGLRINPANVKALNSTSTYHINNGFNYIHVMQGELNQNHTWKALPSPLLINGVFTVKGNLIIQPGSQILMEADAAIYVEQTGSLNASGEAGNKINISGKVSSPGYWHVISFASNNPSNVLKHVNIKDGGGYWYYDHTQLAVNNNARLSLDNCFVNNAYNWGAVIYGGGSIFCGGSAQNTVAGVLSHNTFSGNGAHPSANCIDGCNVLMQ
jgi:hypothetical protein